MKPLPKNLETFCQLSTKRKAFHAAKIEGIRTGRKHYVEKTVCYRWIGNNCQSYRCYTIVLGTLNLRSIRQ